MVYGTYVKLPTHSSPIPDEIRHSPDFWPYFRDCIGAIDGLHVPAFVPELMRSRFRDWKGQVSQNVLVACSMNMEFFMMNSMVLTSGEVTGLSQDRVSKQDAVAGKHRKQVVMIG